MGAIAPSSKSLTRQMVDWIEWDTALHVVEYGPGTGVFTSAIRTRLRDDASFFAIERSANLCQVVRQRCPDMTILEDSVENIERLCEQQNFSQVDAVVCGLPWASFPYSLQTRCMDSLMRVLRPGGQFATFAYWQGLLLPAGRRFRSQLTNYFRDVETSSTAWLNIPPAFVYRCRK